MNQVNQVNQVRQVNQDPMGPFAGWMGFRTICKAFMPVNKGSRFFLRVDGIKDCTRGPRGPKKL